MPTLTFNTGRVAIDMTGDVLFVRIAQASTLVSSSATEVVTSTASPGSTDYRTITTDGNFTAFGSNGGPTAGTVTSSVYIHYVGGAPFHETDLLNINVPISLFRAADTTANVQALWAAITAGNDSIVGGAYDDILQGGAGNDTIDGGAGSNTAVYSGPQSSYAITTNSDGSLTVVDQRSGSPDGTDHLTNIQTLQFSDGVDHIAPVTIPTLTFSTGENGIDMTSDILFVREAQASSVLSTSALRVVTQTPPSDSTVRTIIYNGAFTAFGSNGLPSAGTATSAIYTHIAGTPDQPILHETQLLNINVSASLFQAADTPANVQALWTAITAGADSIVGSAYDDVLLGGAGNDTIDGGGGWNTAVFSGPQSAYSITTNADGSLTVVDQRTGSPDGTDHLINIETLTFSDVANHIGPTTAGAAIALDFAAVLRETSPTSADQSFHDQLAAQAAGGQLTASQAIAAIVQQAQNTSSVATIAYQFFTGGTPSTAGMDYLVSPTGPNPNNLNSAYYQSFSVINRYINFAVNLGAGAGAGAAAFAAAHATESLSQTLSEVYTAIFGTAPSAAKIDALLNTQVPDGLGGTYARSNYFASYGGDGVNGVGTKAAMVGWLLAEGVVSNVGDYALSNSAYLTAIAQGKDSFGVNMIGHYDQASYHVPGG